MLPPVSRSSWFVRFLPSIVLAVVIGVLVAVPLVAHAQEPPGAGGLVGEVLSGLDPLAVFIGQAMVASGLVVGALLWLCSAFPATFDNGTERARLVKLAIALVIGLGLGLATVAPAIPLPGHELVGGWLWLARLLGGFLTATVAAFGRDFVVRGQRVLEERRAFAIPPPPPADALDDEPGAAP